MHRHHILYWSIMCKREYGQMGGAGGERNPFLTPFSLVAVVFGVCDNKPNVQDILRYMKRSTLRHIA